MSEILTKDAIANIVKVAHERYPEIVTSDRIVKHKDEKYIVSEREAPKIQFDEYLETIFIPKHPYMDNKHNFIMRTDFDDPVMNYISSAHLSWFHQYVGSLDYTSKTYETNPYPNERVYEIKQ